MVAVLTDTEEYSIFEMLSDTNFEVGDEISWNENHPSMHTMIANLTKGEQVEVFFQNHWVSKNDLERQLLY